MRITKSLVISGLLIFLLGFSISAANDGGPAEGKPKVVAAVAPVYPQIAVSAHISGEVAVEVEINSAGAVSAAHLEKGHALLKSASLGAARQWKFAPDENKVALRTVRLTFLFIFPEKPLLENESSVVFIPPYRVEIRNRSYPIDISADHSFLELSR